MDTKIDDVTAERCWKSIIKYILDERYQQVSEENLDKYINTLKERFTISTNKKYWEEVIRNARIQAEDAQKNYEQLKAKYGE